jgi:hypothetical protein
MKKKKKKDTLAILLICIVFLLFLVLAIAALYQKLKKQNIAEYCVILIDVTSELSPSQKGMLDNEFKRYLHEAPKNSIHDFYQVGEVNDKLLIPIAKGYAKHSIKDESALTTNINLALLNLNKEFKTPLENAFKSSMNNKESKTSPILESIQSVVITSLGSPDAKKASRKIVLVSDLMQNTESINFYSEIPDYNSLTKKSDYRKMQVDLSGIVFEIWHINPPDSNNNTRLLNLWKNIIYGQLGKIKEDGIIPIY